MAVVFVVAIGIAYVVPFIFSLQPQEVLESPTTSITEAEQTTVIILVVQGMLFLRRLHL